MQIGPRNRLDLVRRYYSAYDDSDSAAMRQLLDPGFTFTSPLDDRIDVSRYFARCWPGHEQIEHFELLDVAADVDRALVRYLSHRYDGTTFSNVERHEFTADAIAHVECFFGALPQ